MTKRPSLLALTAATAALSVIANGVVVASPGPQQPRTRLGVSLDKEAGERDAAAAGRARQLDLREQATRAAEKRMEAAIAQQQPQLAAPPPGAPAAKAAAPEQVFDDLARIYQAMKPAKAAIVFEQLAMDVQVQVAKRMRERSTAMIMAAMTPKAAASLTMALAHREAAPRRSPLLPPG